MRDHYDFSAGRPNPYVRPTKRQVTIRLDEVTLEYFKSLAKSNDMPYQTLINLYLRDCAGQKRRLDLHWHTPAQLP